MRTFVLSTILVLSIVIMFIPVTVKFFTVMNERSDVYTQYELADFPLLTFEELKSEFERLNRLIAEPVGDDPVEFYDIQTQILDLQQKMRKFKAYQTEYSLEVNHIDSLIATSLGSTHLQHLYKEKFGLLAMGEAASRYTEIRDALADRAVVVPHGAMPPFVGTWQLFVNTCLLSLLPMLLLNIIRIKRARLLLWPELFRIIPMTVLWPATCFFYPTRIVKREQVARTLRYAAYAMSILFSFGGVAGNASAQTKKKKEKEDNETVRVIEKDFNFSIEGYPLTGNGGGQYLGPDYNWKYGCLSGFGFAEIGDTPLFSLHSVAVDTPGPVDITFEQGYGPMGYFSRFGPKVNLNNTPIMRKVTSKVFKFIVYSQIFQAVNKKAPAQSAFAWKTKDVNVGKFKLSSEGFYRISFDNKPDLAQPQIWLRLGRWMFGTELSVFGGKLRPLFGMRVAF